VSARRPVGCDAQTVDRREPNQWRELLGETRYTLAEVVARETGEEIATSAARVWTVAECLTKLGANADAPLTLEPGAQTGWVGFTSGTLRALSTVEEVAGMADPVAVAVMLRSDDADL
jgi:hypothetical protein